MEKGLIEAGKIFIEGRNNDEFSRFKSWEYCFEKFGVYKKIKNGEDYSTNDRKEEEELALHLSFYLASWGMYRGSTFLINKSYKININVVNEIKEFINKNKKMLKEYYEINSKESLNNFIENGDDFFQRIEDLGNEICDIYGDVYNVTDTLKTKIIMGTLGITPAYDNYFIEGLKELNINKNFNKESIKACYLYYKENWDKFEELNKEELIDEETKRKFDYPIMKVFDMCIWQYQVNKAKIKKLKELIDESKIIIVEEIEEEDILKVFKLKDKIIIQSSNKEKIEKSFLKNKIVNQQPNKNFENKEKLVIRGKIDKILEELKKEK